MTKIKSLFNFETSPRFEVFFALQTLTDPESRIHDGWKRSALARLSPSFHRKLGTLGGSPFLWPVVADALGSVPVTLPFEEMVSVLAGLPQRELKQRILAGVFHEPSVVSPLLAGKKDLAAAIRQATAKKREWLAFIGLYPVLGDSPMFRGLEFLLRTPGEFQRTVCEVLLQFWQEQFRETWEQIHGSLERSAGEKQRLFQSCTLAEFARLALLRIEVDERRGVIRAVRGGGSVALKGLAAATILPSAFNDQRIWTSYETDNGEDAYFPYFDPAISIADVGAGPATCEPELDPALIFRALGDTTRFAMASLLARNPSTSADLAKTLSVSRPTVSHHIHVLREAGLLLEKTHGNNVLLSLRREVLEQLSDLATRRLFQSKEEIPLNKTRNK